MAACQYRAEVRIRQYSYFAVSSQTMSADDMSARIGLQPDQKRRRGSCRAEPTVVPLQHSWMVCADQPGVPMDEQIREVVDRVLPYRGRNCGSGRRAWLLRQRLPPVVRYFDDPCGEEE